MSAALRIVEDDILPVQRVLALVSGFPAACWQDRTLVILQACVDDSSSAELSIFVLAGFVSTYPRWVEFTKEWEVALKKPPSLEYFKMKEAAACRGQFEGWSFADRDKRVAEFAAIIKKHVVGGFACVMPIEDYKGVFAGKISKVMDNPYFLTFYGVIQTLMAMQHLVGDDRTVDFVFDEQGKQVGQALSAWKYFKQFATPEAGVFIGNPPISRDDKTFLPLQAADILAWKTRRNIMDKASGEVHPVIPSLSTLNCVVETWTKDRLQSMYDRVDVMRRSLGHAFPYDGKE